MHLLAELLDWTAPGPPRIHLGIGETVYTMLVRVLTFNSHLMVILEGEEAKTRLAQQL